MPGSRYKIIITCNLHINLGSLFIGNGCYTPPSPIDIIVSKEKHHGKLAPYSLDWFRT